jgi:hypothetical protein
MVEDPRHTPARLMIIFPAPDDEYSGEGRLGSCVFDCRQIYL